MCLRHLGVWGATQVIKDVKRLWTNYGRIVRSELSPTTSVSRNARFRLFRGKKNIESGIYLLVDFWMRHLSAGLVLWECFC